MRYGHFDDRRKEYVIERPDTPLPWINYLGEDEYCGIVSNNAGGYGFRKSPGLGRLTRYRFNAVPYDRPGRYIYIRDEDGDYWSASWLPVQKPLNRQKVTCRHGLGYTVIESRYRGIASEVLYLVPAGELLEIWRVSLTNRSKRPRNLDVFAYAEFAVPEFAREYDLQYFQFVMLNTFREGMVGMTIRRVAEYARHAYFASLLPVDSFDTQREVFIGQWHDESNPAAVETGRCSNQCINGGNGCGAMHLRVALDPGQSWTNAFLLGSGLPESDGVRARNTFTPERIGEEFESLRRRWQTRLRALQCKTPDPEFNSSVNIWNAYQAHVTFKWSRSASFIEAGGRDGFGYRDTLQDTFAAMHTSAEKARERIVDLLKGQASLGGTVHSVQPLTLVTGQGFVPEKFWSDDHLWIPLAVNCYVRETGDLAFLDRVTPWLDRGDGTVYDHCRQALAFARSQTGARGLLLGLCADWNDSLNLRLQRGESIFTCMLYCAALEQFAELADGLGRAADAAEARGWRTEMSDLVNLKAWDGEWYLRAVRGNGEPIGSSRNPEGAIFIESNTWAVMAGVAPRERAIRTMDSIRKHLATPYGVALCMPPYGKPDEGVGGMTHFPPGFKENGSIFCHASTWAIVAEAMLRRGDRAYEYCKALLPSAMNDQAELRQVEPYVYCQFIKGPADAGFGQGRNPWLTGTAAWAYVAATQYILGIRPSLRGLVVDPCIPSIWSGFSATRIFRGATYTIRVKNPRNVCAGVLELKVNGKAVQGNTVPIAPAGSEVRVEATLAG